MFIIFSVISMSSPSSSSTLGDIQPVEGGSLPPNPPESNKEQEEVLLEPRNEETSKSAEQFYLEKSNSMKVLIAMCIGLDNGNGGKFGETGELEDDSRFPQKKKTMWKPSCKTHLVVEIKRGKVKYYKTQTRTNSQMTKAVVMNG